MNKFKNKRWWLNSGEFNLERENVLTNEHITRWVSVLSAWTLNSRPTIDEVWWAHGIFELRSIVSGD